VTSLRGRACFAATILAIALVAHAADAATEDLGSGFLHHGVATPVSNHRGTVATVDGEDRNVVLVWLFDHRGGYSLLVIDAETGKSREVRTPFPPGGDCPYSSILSSGNRYYTHFNDHFAEFDPAEGEFTFFHKTTRQMAMSMTEDDRGVIWSVTYPNSGLVSYDPATKEFKDYGSLHQENWRQYPRYIAADDKGWVYFGTGNVHSHLLAFDPKAGKAKEMIGQVGSAKGCGCVVRDMDGKVYAHHPGEEEWYRFYEGKAEEVGKRDRINTKPIITGSQGLFHCDFPDGSRLVTCDLINRVLTVKNKAGADKRVVFDYTSEGAHIMGLAAAPDGTICGGTAFPMRYFSYDPETDVWSNRESYGQWNTVARQGSRFFVGGYGGGFLLDWDPAKEWVRTVKGNEDCNPRFLAQCTPAIHRPHELLAHPDGKTLVLGGTPGYGYTGGGLLFWDRETGRQVLVEHTEIIPEHSTMSLAAIPGGRLLGGTTTGAGTGGEKKATEAELYIMDMATKKLEWRAVVFPGVQSYTDLCAGPKGLVYGIADCGRFFVFDSATREVVHEEMVSARHGRTVSHQGPRVFVVGPDGTTYLLFAKGIARIDSKTHEVVMIAESPVPIGLGGDVLDGRIYFGSGSHMYSYTVPRGK
jgi:streptogramin lyase